MEKKIPAQCCKGSVTIVVCLLRDGADNAGGTCVFQHVGIRRKIKAMWGFIDCLVGYSFSASLFISIKLSRTLSTLKLTIVVVRCQNEPSPKLQPCNLWRDCSCGFREDPFCTWQLLRSVWVWISYATCFCDFPEYVSNGFPPLWNAFYLHVSINLKAFLCPYSVCSELRKMISMKMCPYLSLL